MERTEIPAWSDLATEIWMKIFGYLKGTDLNNAHLMSKRFHPIANSMPHTFNMNSIVSENTSLETFQNSSRIYRQIVFSYDNGWSLNDFFKFIEHVDGAKLKNFTLEKSAGSSGPTKEKLLQTLREYPNLESLTLTGLNDRSNMDSNTIASLPKLTDLSLHWCKFNDLTSNIRNCNIEKLSLKIKHDHNSFFPFIESTKASLKELFLLSGDHEWDYTELFNNLNDMRLEKLKLTGIKINTNVFVKFLQSQKESLRLLEFGDTDLDLEAFETICDLSNLERLDIWALNFPNDNFMSLCKLKKLKSLDFSIDSSDNWDVWNLIGYMFEINENLEELNASFKGATEDSIVRLGRNLPNLKVLHFHEGLPETVGHILDSFQQLDHLVINFRDTREALHILHLFSVKNYPKKLKVTMDNYEQYFEVNFQFGNITVEFV
jgi:hypothetical protein